MDAKMNKKDIKKLLHHREPYLMVDTVRELSDSEIKTSKTTQNDEPYIQGHFPNAPVIPGAMLQEFCTQSAGILLTKYYSGVEDYDSDNTKGYAIGVLNKIETAKFYNICKPGKIESEVKLLSHHENLYKFIARVTQNGELMAKIKFNLVNTSDEILTSSQNQDTP